MEDQIVLVNENDDVLGVMGKIEAHQKGLLHRAFSVFIFNDQKQMLLQQRAKDKYHSALLWTNACCSHPRIDETYISAAHRRLNEELGFDCELTEKFKFIYHTPLENNFFEHELDTVFVGIYNDVINPNQDEVASCKWIFMDELKMDLKNNPANYTVWFKIILNEYLHNFSIVS